MKPTLSLSESVMAKAKERAAKERYAKENAAALQIEMQKKAEMRREEKRVRVQKEADEKRYREEERLRKEREAKTQNYFILNQFKRKVPPPGEPVFFGDMTKKFGTWVPHGKGQFTVDEKVKMEGDYIKGDFVSGTIHYENGYSWNGLVLDYKMHGIGVVTKHTLVEKVDSDGEEDHTINDDGTVDTTVKMNREVVYSPLDISRHAVAYENDIICYQDEMLVGRQVEFPQPVFNVYAGHESRSPLGVIVERVKEWQFVIRFHDEVWPKQRVVDFAHISKFKLLRDRPLIYNMNTYGVKSEPHVIYDHRPQPKPQPIDNHRGSNRSLSVQSQINRRAVLLGLMEGPAAPAEGDEPPAEEEGANDSAEDDDSTVHSAVSEATSVLTFETFDTGDSGGDGREGGGGRLVKKQQSIQSFIIPKDQRTHAAKHPSPYYSKRLIDPFPLRKHTEHSVNMFESRAVGVGAAKEEDEALRFQELKKEQWAALIADKRAAAEVIRQKEIEAQSNAALQASVAQQRSLKDASRKELAEDEEETRLAIEREMKRLDDQMSAASSAHGSKK